MICTALMAQNKNETLKEILRLLHEKGPLSIDDVVSLISTPEQLIKNQAAGKQIRKVINKQIHPKKNDKTAAVPLLVQKDSSSKIYISKAGSDYLAGQILPDGTKEDLFVDKANASSKPIASESPQQIELGSTPTSGTSKDSEPPKSLESSEGTPVKVLLRHRILGKILSPRLIIYPSAVFISFAILALTEMRTSFLQSYILSDIMQRVNWKVERGESPRIEFPKHGPFDERLGYSLGADLITKLKAKDFEITHQAVQSKTQYDLLARGVHAIYEEKHQGGLKILSSDNRTIFSSYYPQNYYPTFEEIPAVITQTLLVIENRDLLLTDYPYKNPVFDWVRLGKAIFDFGLSTIIDDHDVPGGSTLATQIEKFRHSPHGRTHNVEEKAIQMISASLRSYRQGRSTLEVRKRIVLDYVNSVPLGAIPGAGEIRGLPHGLSAWHGVDFITVNNQLKDLELKMDQEEGADQRALAFKQVLSLFISQRRPAYYLQQDRNALQELVDKHVRLLVGENIISAGFGKRVLDAKLTFRNNQISYKPERQSFIDRKATDAIRIYLLGLFRFDRLYTLDRLDLSVKSTIDYRAQKWVTDILQKLSDPAFAAENGLLDNRLLAQGNPKDVIYSFTLREIIGDRSVLRVQSDNIDGPFNVNDGVKLELGSTAKLRTIISYLQVIETIYRRHFNSETQTLKKNIAPQKDRLTTWTLNYLETAEDKSLAAVLDAAMNRTYSANPTEKFFTGAGVHKFSNFTKDDDQKIVTMYESLRKSINLPFIRLMRDIVQYYIAGIPESEDILADVKNKTRISYLENFARKEGRQFLNRFYIKYRGKKPDEIMKLFLSRGVSLKKMTNIFILSNPDGKAPDLMTFANTYGGPNFSKLKLSTFEQSLSEYKKSNYSLQDRGVISGVHPLELWCVSYLFNNPQSTYTATIQSSDQAMLDSYQWLFQSREKTKQDKRIRIILEDRAFQELHANWVRVGYPFSFLVPTLATSIGSSGDKPSALADLMGIILSNGMRLPTARVDEISFAEDTPFETRLHYAGLTSAPTRVMSEEVAKTAKKALLEVVEQGTAQRVKGAFVYGDQSVAQIGGKTGTGDNRYSVYAPGGKIIESKTKSRTATFVFYIGDRFYGTLTAYVPTSGAKEFNFTSALPVQVLKILSPALNPLIDYQPTEINSPWR
jgi:membrane peptidoglycan carboxypeptidase